MKTNLLILILFVSALVSCRKDEVTPERPSPQAPATQSVQMTLIRDVTWHHLTGALANLRFASDGTYYENTTNDGNWSQVGSDSIFVTRQSNSFYYRVLSVTTDTLKITNPVFGNLTYYR